MKTRTPLFYLLSFVFCLFLSPMPLALSQIPQGFNYQVVASDAQGHLIKNSPLPVRISFQSDSLGGTIFWQELHSSVITSDIGVINLVIGKGERQTVSTVASFNAIAWNTTPKFLKVEINHNGWKTMGSSRLWSVPYAMVAGDLAGPVKKLAVEGETQALEEALFEVKNKDGQTIFAVYNEGVRVFVSDGAKAIKGGFAVGGFGTDKQESQKYLFVTKDSTRIYVDNDPANKKTKGGFAVGGFDATKGDVVPFVDLTPKNYFIGHEAGTNITGGEYNSFMGYRSGQANKDGNCNIFIGYESGYSTLGTLNVPGGSEGSWNCFIGYQAGYSNIHGANNTFIGSSSGRSTNSDHNTCLGSNSGTSNIGYANTFIGSYSGMKNTTGSNNVFLGRGSGWNLLDGSGNTFIGTGAGANIKSGQENIVIGAGAMGENYFAGSGTGSSNIVIGNKAGYSSSNGSSNIFIGNQAGYEETGSNLLIIENSSSVNPLVYGNFDTNKFKVNGDIEALTVSTPSDASLKQNITQLTDVIEKLGLIRGIYFDWDLSKESQLLLKEGRQIGVIAQEVEKVYPELVLTNDFGYKVVDYSKFAPVFLEAVKEQQQQIESQKEEIEELKMMMLEMKNEIALLSR